jgi:alpha-glucosidase
MSHRDKHPRTIGPGSSFATVLLASVVLISGATAGAAEVRSPDGTVVVTFDLVSGGGLEGCPAYSVTYRGRPVLVESRLGLDLAGAPALDHGFTIAATSRARHDATWKPVYGERSAIRDHYNELVVTLEDAHRPPRGLVLKFRAYDEGAAFCYHIPERSGTEPVQVAIAAEQTRFRFAGDPIVWATYSAQGTYSAVPLDALKPDCERPLTVELADDCYAAIAEARLVDYARMRLGPAEGEPHTLRAILGGPVHATTPLATPWRVILLGDTPGRLIEHNGLILNLNDPCALADTSWIRPGKVIREATLTTAGGKACVDFAVARGLQYVEFDAGWYGPEGDPRSDARAVARPDLDLEEVIRYGRDKGIGVILYVNRRALERQMDEIFPLYERWGVKGVKFGFVQVGSQEWTAWVNAGVRKAAAHHLMVDVHDEFRPTGYSRTYPNLMTVEGVRGNETFPTAEHDATLPFTRFLAGPADYTICWYSDRLKNTHAHQLACAVAYYSPWQFLFWYDRPAQYRGEPEVAFFAEVPTIWDETRVLSGRIGQWVTIARRSGESWFVGTLNAVERRRLEIPLSFLERGRRYVATTYCDARPGGGEPTEVKVEAIAVDAGTVIRADLAANGGHAMRIAPESANVSPVSSR